MGGVANFDCLGLQAKSNRQSLMYIINIEYLTAYYQIHSPVCFNDAVTFTILSLKTNEEMHFIIKPQYGYSIFNI